MKYHQAKDGEWIRPARKGYRMACCDCGLVHVVDFSRAVRFRASRDKRATAARRRAKA